MPAFGGTPATWRLRDAALAQVMVEQDSGDCAGGQAEAKLHELSLDPAVAPSGVLPSQAHHEGCGVLIHPGTSWSAVGVSEAPDHQLSMPGEQCGRRHPESAPA
jgi:hypothetical protein